MELLSIVNDATSPVTRPFEKTAWERGYEVTLNYSPKLEERLAL